MHAALRTLSSAAQGDAARARAASVRTLRELFYLHLVAAIGVVVVGVVTCRRLIADGDRRADGEAEARRAERFLDAMLDLVPVMVYVKDAAELRFVRFNRAAEQLTGLTRAAVLGHDDFDLYPRPLAEHAATLDRAVLAGDAMRDIPEETVVAPNGAVRTLHTRKVAIHDDEGRPAYLLGVSEDITLQKRADREILLAREEAATANRARSAFLARVSHEVRTPLNSIIGFSQLLEEQSVGPLTERQQKYLGNVIASGRQLLELINDLLDLSKIETGSMTLSLAPVGVQPLVREAVKAMSGAAGAGGLRLVEELGRRDATVLADAARLRQIVEHLLANAVKFTPAGGTVTVRVGASPNRSSSGAPLVRISVIDTGVGIRPDDLERIFLEFEQVDADADRARQGTGLGLPLARRLAKLHGGSLWAESDFGLGSSFHLELPVHAPNGADRPHTTSASVAVSDAEATVLIAADTGSGDSEMIRTRLDGAGIRATIVTSADALMQQVSAVRPRALAFDVAVLRRDGLAVLRELKRDPRTARVPVVLLAMIDAQCKGLSLGTFHWVAKPLQREALLACVQQVAANATTRHPLVIAADDDPAALDVLRAMLEGAGYRAMITTDALHAVHLATTQQPDAIVVELAMPELSGFELLLHLRQAAPTRTIPVILCDRRALSPAEWERIDALLHRPHAAPTAPDLIDVLREAVVIGS